MKYATIVADPPWEVSRSFGGANWRKGERHRPALDYPTLTVDEIAALPVAGMADSAAHLYLWTIQSKLRETFAVAEAWGFRHSATLAWCKPRGGFVGGTYFSNAEFVLFCRRGVLPAKRRESTQWFTWPRSRVHSRKPDEFFAMVEEVSPGPYLELFSRRARPGWHVWGNEVESDVELVA